MNRLNPLYALEQIGQVFPDIVLLDIHLQGKDSGIALGERISLMHKLPILFTTSNVTEKTISLAVAISPVAYLIKPVDKFGQLEKSGCYSWIRSYVRNPEVSYTTWPYL